MILAGLTDSYMQFYMKVLTAISQDFTVNKMIINCQLANVTTIEMISGITCFTKMVNLLCS